MYKARAVLFVAITLLFTIHGAFGAMSFKAVCLDSLDRDPVDFQLPNGLKVNAKIGVYIYDHPVKTVNAPPSDGVIMIDFTVDQPAHNSQATLEKLQEIVKVAWLGTKQEKISERDLVQALESKLTMVQDHDNKNEFRESMMLVLKESAETAVAISEIIETKLRSMNPMPLVRRNQK